MSSAFPPPPPYYKLYYDHEDVEAGQARSPPSPPPAVDGEYQVFGLTYTTREGLPSLSEQGVHQLYSLEGRENGPSSRYKSELHKLNRSLLVNFMGLLQSLIENPSNSARKVEDLGLLLRNMHHLLNSLRPHQARATLIAMLKSQIDARKAAAQDVRDRRDAAVTSLRKALEELQAASSSGPESSPPGADIMEVDGISGRPASGAVDASIQDEQGGPVLDGRQGGPAHAQSTSSPSRVDGRGGRKDNDGNDDDDELWAVMDAVTDEDGCAGDQEGDPTVGMEHPHPSQSVGVRGAGRDVSLVGGGAVG